MAGQPDLRTVLEEHVDAFNAHDTERLLRGLDEEITWHTGSEVVSGREALRTVFDDWLWDRAPRLDVRDLAVDGDRAAMECVEYILLDGRRVEFPIAAFFTVRNGLLTSVRVYREGRADLSDAATARGGGGGRWRRRRAPAGAQQRGALPSHSRRARRVVRDRRSSRPLRGRRRPFADGHCVSRR